METIKKVELNKITKVILISLLGTILLTISAKIKIPFYPVPMTMQTFVVLFLGIILGPKIALLTVSLYLFEGIFGLPVFAGTPEKGMGFAYFVGPTMGYLIGFLVATYLAGYFEYKNCCLIFNKHNSQFSDFDSKFCHCCSIDCDFIILHKNPIVKFYLYIFSFYRN